MKAMRFVFPLVFCLTGCASKNASNPGAAVVGPDYLDVMAEYPPDRDTQYYYPRFGVRNYEASEAVLKPMPKPDVTPEVAGLLTYLPEPSREVTAITGKGYPCLERTGIRLFTAAEQK